MNDQLLNRRLSLAALLAAFSFAACTVEVTTDVRAGGPDGGATDAAADANAADARGDAGDAAVVNDAVSPDAIAADAAAVDAIAADATAADRAASDATAGDATSGASGDRAAEAAPPLDAADASDATACYAEEVVAADGGSVDGGVPMCESLSYATDTCVETGDAGSVTVKAYGVQVCERFRSELKPSAFRALFDCLAQIPRGAENCRTDRGARCMGLVFGAATCQVPSEAVDGGTLGCAEVVASCRSSDAGPGVTQDDCARWLHPLKSAVRREVFSCYTDPENAAVPCAARFADYCVFPTSIRP